MFELLLTQGANIETRDNDGQTILFKVIDLIHANSNNRNSPTYAQSLEMILAKGPNIDAKDNMGMTPFLYAIEKAHMDSIYALVQHGANIHALDNENKNAFHFVAKIRDLKDKKNISQSLVNLLIKNRVDINVQSDYGDTALIIAVNYGNKSAFNALIDNNANVNITKDAREVGLKAALEYTRSSDKVSMAFRIISHPQFDASLKYHQQATIWFIDNGMYEVANALLDKGVDINLTNSNKRTLLMQAVIRGNEEFVQSLMDRGADKSLKDNDGATALDLAVKNGYLNIVKLLQQDY